MSDRTIKTLFCVIFTIFMSFCAMALVSCNSMGKRTITVGNYTEVNEGSAPLLPKKVTIGQNGETTISVDVDSIATLQTLGISGSKELLALGKEILAIKAELRAAKDEKDRAVIEARLKIQQDLYDLAKQGAQSLLSGKI